MRKNTINLYRLLTIAEGGFLLAALGLDLKMMETFLYGEYLPFIMRLCLSVIMIFIIISNAAVYFTISKEKKYDLLRIKIQSAMLAVNTFVCILPMKTRFTISAATFLYMSMIISSFIFFMMKHRTIRSYIFSIVCILLIGYPSFDIIQACLMNSGDDELEKTLIIVLCMVYLMIGIMVHLLFRIVAISMRRIRLDILIRIADRSMAGEILGGFFLLIGAFSFVIKVVEPGINTLSDSLWYCFAIVTTIGFGDITATTIAGRILSVILGIYGIIVVALITSIIVNFYTEVREEELKALSEKDTDKEKGSE